MTTQNQANPERNQVAELMMSMAMSGKSWSEFTDEVADKVAERLSGIMTNRRGTSVNGEKPIRGIRALSSELGASTATVQKMIFDGNIPFSKVGNRYVFFMSEVHEALKGGAAV